MAEYGEGLIRMNKAEIYLIKQVRIARRKWSLTPKALNMVLRRVTEAENENTTRDTFPTHWAVEKEDGE